MIDHQENYESDSAPPALPSIKDVTLIIISTIIFTFTLIFLAIHYGGNLSGQYGFYFAETLFILPSIIYILLSKKSFAASFRFNKIKSQHMLFSLLAGVAAIVILNFMLEWFSGLPGPEWLSGIDEASAKAMMESLIFKNMTDVIVITFTVIIAAAVAEEMLFRGIIQQTIEKRFSVFTGILTASIMFTVLHLMSILPIFLLALALGVIAWRCNSIYPSIIIHGMNNGLSLFALNINESLQQNPEQGIEFPLITLPVCILLFIYSMKKLWIITKEQGK